MVEPRIVTREERDRTLHMIEETLMAYCYLTVRPSAGFEALESKKEGYRQMMSALKAALPPADAPPRLSEAEVRTCATCQQAVHKRRLEGAYQP